MSRILVVDDDPRVQDLLAMYLGKAGFEVVGAGDGDRALWEAGREPPALVVLDVMMPGMDGYEVFRRLRAIADVPVVFLTCRDDDVDVIVGLELGADDYITKPFNPREVVARVKAVLRRSERRPTVRPRLVVAGLSIDPETREARAGDELLRLTRKEFDILWLLASRPRVVYTREQVMEQVWGDEYEYQDVHTVDTHVKRLRRKLAEAGARCTIEAVWGTGYRFVETG